MDSWNLVLKRTLIGIILISAAVGPLLAQQVTVIDKEETPYNVDKGGAIVGQDDTWMVSQWVRKSGPFGAEHYARYFVLAKRYDFLPFDYEWPVHNGIVSGRMPLIEPPGSRSSAMVWSSQGYGTPDIAESKSKIDVLNCGVFFCGIEYTLENEHTKYHVPLTLAGTPVTGPSEAALFESFSHSIEHSFEPLQTRSLVERIDDNDQTIAILAEFVTTVEQLPGGDYHYLYEAKNSGTDVAQYDWLLAGLLGSLGVGETHSRSFTSPYPPVVSSSQASIEFAGFQFEQSLASGPVALLAPIPEPSSFSLVVLFVCAMGSLYRRQEESRNVREQAQLTKNKGNHLLEFWPLGR